MALAEVAEHLGVSRQRAAVLVDRPDFPAPLDTLTVGRIWAAADVRKYAASRRQRLDSGQDE
ncbi:DNA-binding protein [Plantactinospora sp. S1510]|uniref:DNA-binding protein n=1 Tax=Plantactinospora alkalitolerans TaxID=2789879 RepID=A0ABS0GW43_9ACTN|nr:DNA-binding protein [Plantactinospora alkalitolerans]MBF9130208.1 DNA-binding protein [Plantactinospora alkalitolerans]